MIRAILEAAVVGVVVILIAYFVITKIAPHGPVETRTEATW